MLTSGLKILPAANPGVRSLPARNERQGACKQGAIREDLPGPRGAGSPAQQAQVQRLAVCSYSSPFSLWNDLPFFFKADRGTISMLKRQI